MGEFEITGIEKAPTPTGRQEIIITYDIDSNGILKVKAVVPSNGTKKEMTIRNENRFSETEI